jgi:hypothetical protein
MDYIPGTSTNFVHLHEGKWYIYQKVSVRRFLTPEKTRKEPMKVLDCEAYFAHEPLLNIAYSYARKNLALAKARELIQVGTFI